jgi:hypothetical protein
VPRIDIGNSVSRMAAAAAQCARGGVARPHAGMHQRCTHIASAAVGESILETVPKIIIIIYLHKTVLYN